MAEVAKIHQTILIKLANASKRDMLSIVTNWLQQKATDSILKESILERARFLQAGLETIPLKSSDLTNRNKLEKWVKDATEKTRYWERVQASLRLYCCKVTNTGRGAAMFWGFHPKYQEEIKQKCPIDFIVPADDPRQREFTYKKYRKLTERFIRQRKMEPELYLGYHGPMEWLWQEIAFTHANTKPGELGTLEYLLAPAKICILLELYIRNITPKLEAEIIDKWNVSVEEFKQLAQIRGSKKIASVCHYSSSTIGSFLSLRHISNYPIGAETEKLNQLPTKNEALKLYFISCKEASIEDIQEYNDQYKWHSPPNSYDITDLFKSQDILKDISGGLDLALSTNPEETLQNAGKWLECWKTTSVQKKTLALHAFVYAWCCGNLDTQTDRHIEHRKTITEYCKKYNLSDPTTLEWRDLDKWLEIAERCSIASEYFKRSREGEKLVYPLQAIQYIFKITAESIYIELAEPKNITRLDTKLHEVLKSGKYVCKYELTPIERFINSSYDPIAIALMLLGCEEVDLETENKIFSFIKIPKEDIQTILCDQNSDAMRLCGFRTRIRRAPKNCLSALLEVISANCIAINDADACRLERIPNLISPAPFLLEIYRIYQNTKKRLHQEENLVKDIVKLIEPKEVLKKPAGVSIGLPDYENAAYHINWLLRLDGGYPLAEKERIQDMRNQLCKDTARSILVRRDQQNINICHV